MKKRFINEKRIFETSDPGFAREISEFIESSLESIGTDHRLILRTLLIADEITAGFAVTAADGRVSVRVRRRFGDAEVEISALGEPVDLSGDSSYDTSDISALGDAEAERAIRSIMLKSLEDRLKYTNKHGINRVRITVGQADKSMFTATIVALLAGLLVGALLSAAPGIVSDGVCGYLLTPAKTMFMNALKMIIAPVVFFSIVSCIAQFKNLSELGRIGAKVMGMYLSTTVVAVLISIGMSFLLHPGPFGFAMSIDMGAGTMDIDTSTDTSLLNTIINIIPSNFVKPFLESDTLQIIILAVLVGVAVGKIGDYAPVLQEFFEACNSLFLTVTTIVSRFIPLAVFCSVALMMVQMGGNSLLAVLGMLGTYLLCILCMMTVYGLLVLVLGRMDPRVFYKKNRKGMLTSFTLSSSSAAMPTNIMTCTEKMGISPKVCNFSIPLGSTVNMDGTCMMMTVASLFLARAYGIVIPGSMYLSLIITIVLLSLGAPGVPGAVIVCLGVVLAGIGVPVEAVGLIIGISPFLDMFNTMSNTTGDVACALIVANSEGLIDKEVFYKPMD